MSTKEKVFQYMADHLHAPRHDFKMSENIGIEEFIGPTVVVASILLVHGKKVTEIDVSSKETAVWLTTPKEIEGRRYDFIIGPDGKASAIAIGWNGDQPEIFYQDKELGLQRLDKVDTISEGKDENQIAFSNKPKGSTLALVYKTYDEESLNKRQKEAYTIVRMTNYDYMGDAIGINKFASKENLVSGMNNRGFGNRLSTGWWAISNADRHNVPFGRGLKLKK